MHCTGFASTHVFIICKMHIFSNIKILRKKKHIHTHTHKKKKKKKTRASAQWGTDTPCQRHFLMLTPDRRTYGRMDERTERRKLYTPRHTSYARGIKTCTDILYAKDLFSISIQYCSISENCSCLDNSHIPYQKVNFIFSEESLSAGLLSQWSRFNCCCRRKSFQPKTGSHCTQPVIINLPLA